jgi:hypothetical protein
MTLQNTTEISTEISHDWNFTTTEISHVKGFARNYKLQCDCKNMWKDFTWNYKQWRRQASEIGGGGRFEGQNHIFLGGQDRIVK